MIYVTKSPKETQQLAGFLFTPRLTTDDKNNAKGNRLLSVGLENRKKSLVIALEGELGAGKTVFAQGLAQALGIKAKIKSPTFTLMKKYSISSSRNFKFKILNYKFLYHLDCYRLRDHKDLSTLGIEDILANTENIVLIEWSDRVKKILPKKHIKIHIDHISKNERKITVS